MEQNLLIYNTLTRRKEVFEPLNAPAAWACMSADLRSTAIRTWATPVRQ